MDSVPEKTLEHWASTYLTYRFRSHAGLWWPTFGHDIAVEHLPGKCGKNVFLEMKTSSFDLKDQSKHVVKIDVPQLTRYLSLAPALQPYYVFPSPRWQGEIMQASHRAGIDPTDIAFSRNIGRAPVGWVAEWLWVLPASSVATVINKAILNNAKTATLVTYTAGQGIPTVRWVNNAGASPSLMSWRNFWDYMVKCGDTNLSQVITLPQTSVPTGSLSRTELLKTITETQNQKIEGEVIHLGWDGGSYSADFVGDFPTIEHISENLLGVHLSLKSLTVSEN